MPAFSSTFKHVPSFLKSKWGIAVLAIVVIGGAYFFFSGNGKSKYQFVAVTKGPITEVVSVTGNTTPIASVSLAFGNSGTIARIYSAVGERVFTGELLALLNTGDLSAQLKQAQANVDSEQAKLGGLIAGSRPEDIAAAQAAYDKSAQDLANLYAGVSDTAADAYAKTNDAVRTQLSAFFSNAETKQPMLTFTTSNSQAKSDAEQGRASVGAALTGWQSDLFSITAASSPTDLDAAIQKDLTRLAGVSAFLGSVSTALNGATNLDAATLAAYKSGLGSAIAETNTATKNLNTAGQNIASQKLAAEQLKAELDLAKAGSTPQDIAAQKAQVEQAQASVESIRAKLADSEIIAPQSGVVTQFDAKVGQRATAGTALVAIISDSAFEVDADVPETDIGKVAVGDAVGMTFDAFPNETFPGSVFYVDPAETISQGVVSYKVKVSFAKPDPRMKSGLTANLDIETAHKDTVFILPQYAILQNDQGTFVEILASGKVRNVPVVLGLQDDKGNVEVVSGVSEAEKVLNIGLKQ